MSIVQKLFLADFAKKVRKYGVHLHLSFIIIKISCCVCYRAAHPTGGIFTQLRGLAVVCTYSEVAVTCRVRTTQVMKSTAIRFRCLTRWQECGMNRWRLVTLHPADAVTPHVSSFNWGSSQYSVLIIVIIHFFLNWSPEYNCVQ